MRNIELIKGVRTEELLPAKFIVINNEYYSLVDWAYNYIVYFIIAEKLHDVKHCLRVLSTQKLRQQFMAPLVEALRYKPKGRGFDYR
jgi:hypothetical protein